MVPYKATGGMVPYNPTVESLYAPIVGPKHPLQDRVAKRNNLAGAPLAPSTRRARASQLERQTLVYVWAGANRPRRGRRDRRAAVRGATADVFVVRVRAGPVRERRWTAALRRERAAGRGRRRRHRVQRPPAGQRRAQEAESDGRCRAGPLWLRRPVGRVRERASAPRQRCTGASPGGPRRATRTGTHRSFPSVSQPRQVPEKEEEKEKPDEKSMFGPGMEKTTFHGTATPLCALWRVGVRAVAGGRARWGGRAGGRSRV